MRKILALPIVAVIVVGVLIHMQTSKESERSGIESTVSRVIDGDTIELANGDVVRLIGLDAPEKDQPYYKEVISELKKIEGEVVRIEKDKTNKDRYGRYLRYVFLDEKFVNLEMIRSGLAYVYIVSPDNKYESEFIEAEILARSSGVGIWSRSEHSDCVDVPFIHYNAKGDDTKNLGDEFFHIKNMCEGDIHARKWSFRNSLGSFKLPDFTLTGGSEVKVISGPGKNSAGEIFLGSEKPVWRNTGDTIYMKDAAGNVISAKTYKVN